MMDSIDNIAQMLEPDNEIERMRIKLRLRELAMEIRIYHIEHPNTKLSQEQILRRVKRNLAWRIIRSYLLRPFRAIFLISIASVAGYFTNFV